MRVSAAHHQMRDTVRERVGLAGTGARDDQERAHVSVGAVLDRRALIRIEAIEVVHANHVPTPKAPAITFRFCSQTAAACSAVLPPPERGRVGVGVKDDPHPTVFGGRPPLFKGR